MKYFSIIILFGFTSAMQLWAQQSKTAEENTAYFDAIAMYQQNRFSESIDFFTKAMEVEPNDLELLIKRGEAFYCSGKYKQAITDFLQVEKRRKGLCSFQLARCYAQVNDYQNAMKYLELHLKSRYKKPRAIVRLDSAFAKLDDTQMWEKFWNKDRYNRYESLLSDAEYARKTERYKQAYEILDQLLQKFDKMHEAYFLRAKVALQQNDYKNALSDLDKAIRYSKSNIEYLTQRARLLYKLEKYRKALNDYNQVIEIFPYDTKIYYERALVEKELKKNDEAIADITRYLKYYDTDYQAIYQCGTMHLANENYFKALELFGKTIANSPTKAEYFIARANTYLKTNTFKYAYNDYSMALDLQPHNGEVYYNRGIARLNLGDYKGACSDWQQAMHYGYLKAYDYIEKNCRNY